MAEPKVPAEQMELTDEELNKLSKYYRFHYEEEEEGIHEEPKYLVYDPKTKTMFLE